MNNSMRSTSSDSARWFFLPPDPPRSAPLRRSGGLIIAALAFFTLGLLVVALMHTTGHPALATHNSRQHIQHQPHTRHAL